MVQRYLREGHGYGFDADTVDAAHATETPSAGAIPIVNDDLGGSQLGLKIGTFSRVNVYTSGGEDKMTMLSAANDGTVYMTVNCWHDGTSWQRMDVADPAFLLRMKSDQTTLQLYKASAGANPISAWDILNSSDLWHAGNDGSGSGLDADTLDTFHASQDPDASEIVALDANANLNMQGKTVITQFTPGGGAGNDASVFQSTGNLGLIYLAANLTHDGTDWKRIDDTNPGAMIRIRPADGLVNLYAVSAGSGYIASWDVYDGTTIWHAGNDGTGSGLDADMLDGQHIGTVFGRTTVDQRDIDSIYIPAGTNPEPTIISTLTGSVPGTAGQRHYGYWIPHPTLDGYGVQVVSDAGETWFRDRTLDAWGSWRKVWHSANTGQLSAELTGVPITDCNDADESGFYWCNTTTNSPGAGAGTYYIYAIAHSSASYVHQICVGADANVGVWQRTKLGGSWGSWYEIWTSYTDGSGSGLDADTVDGSEAAAFVTHALATAGNDFLVASGAGAFVKKTLEEVKTILDINVTSDDWDTVYDSEVRFNSTATNGPWGGTTVIGVWIPISSGDTHGIQIVGRDAGGSNQRLWWRGRNASVWGDWHDIWQDAYDGAGTGLDADKLDGYASSTSGGATVVPVTDANSILQLGSGGAVNPGPGATDSTDLPSDMPTGLYLRTGTTASGMPGSEIGTVLGIGGDTDKRKAQLWLDRTDLDYYNRLQYRHSQDAADAWNPWRTLISTLNRPHNENSSANATLAHRRDCHAWVDVTSSFTGTLVIKLPDNYTNQMMRMKISGFDFTNDANSHWEVHLAGYDYSTTSTWSRASASSYGHPPFDRVRFGNDGAGRTCILLGTTSTTWTYPGVCIDDHWVHFDEDANDPDGATKFFLDTITSETGYTIDSTIYVSTDDWVRQYIQVFTPGEFDPADATTYYFGACPGPIANMTTGGEHRIYLDQPGWITRANLYFRVTGISASSETFSAYIRLNNTTDYLIQTAAISSSNRFNNRSMSVPIAENDYIEIKIVTPTWTTNPTELRIMGTLGLL